MGTLQFFQRKEITLSIHVITCKIIKYVEIKKKKIKNSYFKRNYGKKVQYQKPSVDSTRSTITHKAEITSRILFMMDPFCQGIELMTQVLESAGLTY